VCNRWVPQGFSHSRNSKRIIVVVCLVGEEMRNSMFGQMFVSCVWQLEQFWRGRNVQKLIRTHSEIFTSPSRPPPATKLIKSSIAKPSLRVRRKEYPKRKRCFLSQSIATCCQHANAPANIPCATYTLEKLHAQYCVTNLAKWNPNEHCFLWRNAFWKIPGS